MFPLHKHGEEEASLHSNSSDDPAATSQNLFDAEEDESEGHSHEVVDVREIVLDHQIFSFIRPLN